MYSFSHHCPVSHVHHTTTGHQHNTHGLVWHGVGHRATAEWTLIRDKLKHSTRLRSWFRVAKVSIVPVCERESEMDVREFVWERECVYGRGRVCMFEWERDCVCVWERSGCKRECVCVRENVYECEWARESVRSRESFQINPHQGSNQANHTVNAGVLITLII